MNRESKTTTRPTDTEHERFRTCSLVFRIFCVDAIAAMTTSAALVFALVGGIIVVVAMATSEWSVGGRREFIAVSLVVTSISCFVVVMSMISIARVLRVAWILSSGTIVQGTIVASEPYRSDTAIWGPPSYGQRLTVTYSMFEKNVNQVFYLVPATVRRMEHAILPGSVVEVAVPRSGAAQLVDVYRVRRTKRGAQEERVPRKEGCTDPTTVTNPK